MSLENIRQSIPGQTANTLLPDEQVYFYSAGGGCASGGNSYLMVTDSRVMGMARVDNKNGSFCTIPLEHVSAVRVTQEGCLSSGSGVWVTSSGGAGTGTKFMIKKEVAQQATNVIQLAIQARKGH